MKGVPFLRDYGLACMLGEKDVQFAGTGLTVADTSAGPLVVLRKAALPDVVVVGEFIRMANKLLAGRTT
jgi:hypothetical protein